MSLSKQIVSDLTAAMKAQDATRTSTLRMVKAAMMNRQIEKGAELDDDDMQKLLRSLVKQRRDSIEQYEKAGRQELVDKETAEIEIIETYLPQAASREEIEQAVARSHCRNRRQFHERHGQSNEGRPGRSGRKKRRWTAGQRGRKG